MLKQRLLDSLKKKTQTWLRHKEHAFCEKRTKDVNLIACSFIASPYLEEKVMEVHF